ncbi:MAG: hypothetical protein Sylvanvirus36_1, partial [Sylvanvirus sp.]
MTTFFQEGIKKDPDSSFSQPITFTFKLSYFFIMGSAISCSVSSNALSTWTGLVQLAMQGPYPTQQQDLSGTWQSTMGNLST